MPSPLVALESEAEVPRGPTMSRVRRFVIQSYFSDALGPNALLPQPTNSEGFVISTVTEEQVRCFGVALHPDSQTPVAVQFRGGAGGDSGAYLVKPGEIVRPSGPMVGPFDGFKWGLPFGWLGGGVAHLLVLLTPDADVDFTGGRAPEVLFHRLRLLIRDPAVPPAPLPTTPNWPLRFPWPSAVASLGAVLIDQRGEPSIAIAIPTRMVLRLREGALAAPDTMRMIWTSTDPFDVGGLSGLVVGTDTSYFDVAWPANGLAAVPAFPVATLDGPENLLGGDFSYVTLWDFTPGGALVGEYVDIIRYGLI